VAKYASVFARCVVLAAIIGLWPGGVVAAADASLSGRDVQIIAKALGFLEPAPHGGTVAVVFASASAASRADAQGIVALFGGGIASAGGTVTAKAVPADAVGDGSGYVAVILAAGAAGGGPGAQQPHGLLSITGADELVRSGKCVMAVHSQPRVEIIVNRAAAHAAGIDFTAAFGMLVHEI
jgi:hypothetical protein